MAKNDLEKDDRFLYRMEAKDGSDGFDFNGSLREIIINQSIIYQLEDERLVTITFSKSSDNIELVQPFEDEGTNNDERQKDGWQAILYNFKRYVEP
jgi:uncharacterized protein YndB with AHSA1/START domain